MIVESMQNIGQLVRHHRRLAVLSQTELADLSGVSRTAIQRIEEGHPAVQMDTLFKVLKVLNVALKILSPLDLENPLPVEEAA